MNETTPAISFGDNVRILHSTATEVANLAGKIGPVYGFTTPSTTGIEVIGEVSDDFAIAVHFKDLGESLWFAMNLIEFVDHGEGTEISVTGSSSKWVRAADGQWITQPNPDSSASPSPIPQKKPLWQFW
jgi:hypothetical protein